MVLWDVQCINFRLTQTSGFNTLHILLAGKGQMNVVMDTTNYNEKLDALVNYKQTYEALNLLSPKSD